MTRVLTALVLMAVSLLAAYCSPVNKYSPHCKVDKTVQDLIWHLLPLSVQLGGNVYGSYVNISTKWLTPSDQWRTADFSLSIAPQQLNTSGLMPRSILLADQKTLNSFLALLRNSSAEFQRLPHGTSVVLQLRNLEDELRFMIAILRRLERIFSVLQGTETPANTSMVSVTSGSQVIAVMPLSTTHDSPRTSNSTTPTIHSVALRVSVILDDLYSSLFQMDADFNKIRKTKCF